MWNMGHDPNPLILTPNRGGAALKVMWYGFPGQILSHCGPNLAHEPGFDTSVLEQKWFVLAVESLWFSSKILEMLQLKSDGFRFHRGHFCKVMWRELLDRES